MPRGNFQRKNSKSQFPAPRYMKVVDDNNRSEALVFFKYWNDLPAEMVDLADVKVYRTWPRIDLKAIDPDRKTVEIKVFHGKIPFAPEDYRDWFLKHFGSGGYRLIANERGVPGAVMECYFTVKTTPLEEAPPKVDPRTVIPGAIENKEYIDWAHTQAIVFPWEENQQVVDRERREKEEDEMTGEVITAVKDLAKDAMQATSEKNRLEMQLEMERSERNRPAPPPPVDRTAENAAIGVIAKAAEKSIEMVTSHAGKQWDPVEVMRATAEFQKGQNSSAEKSVEAMAGAFKDSIVEMRTMHKETLTFFGEQLTKITERVTQTSVVTAAVERKSIVEEYEEFKVKADLFGFRRNDELVPARDHAAEENASAPQKNWALSLIENIGQFAPIVNIVMVYGANMMHNWAVGKSGTGKPEEPREAFQRAQQQQATQQPVAQQPTDPRQVLMMVIDQPIFKSGFISHFFEAQCDGHTFAEFVNTEGTMAGNTQNGRKIYLMLREAGADNLKLLVRGNVDIWSKVGGLPQKFDQFIAQFVDYDEWFANGGDSEDEDSAGEAA